MNFTFDINSLLELWSERLISASWQGGLFLALAWILCRFGKSLSATAKCWIWRIAYLKFIVVLLLGGVVELPILQPSQSNPTPSTIASLSDDSIPATESNEFAADEEIEVTPTRGAVALPSRIETQPSNAASTQKNLLIGNLIQATIFGIWLVGAITGIFLIGKQYSTVNRIVRHSRTVTEKSIVNSYRRLCSQLRMTTSPRLATTSLITTPMLVGAIYPTIVIPTSMLKSLSADDLRLIIAHELGHAKRRDLLWNWLLVFVRAIFFFHPLVWLTQKRFALDQEIACDQFALATTNGNFQQYGNLLVKCSASTSRGAARSLAAVGAVSSFKALRERILEMNRMNRQPSQLAGLMSAVVVIASLAFVAPVKLVAQQRIVEDGDTATNSVQVGESSSSASSSDTAISSNSSQETSNERKDVSVSVSNDGVRESIKVKWKNNGEVSVVYSSDADDQRAPQKYNLKNIEELRQENAAAYRFYKRHVTSTPGNVSAQAGGGAGRATDAIGVGSNASQGSNASRRYRTDDPPAAGRGVGTGAGATSNSSSWSNSSAMGRNGQTQQSNQSGSSSSSSNSGNGNGGNANQQLIQQVRDMMEQTDDQMMRQTLQQMLDQLENQNPNQSGQNQNRMNQGQGSNRATGNQSGSGQRMIRRRR